MTNEQKDKYLPVQICKNDAISPIFLAVFRYLFCIGPNKISQTSIMIIIINPKPAPKSSNMRVKTNQAGVSEKE